MNCQICGDPFFDGPGMADSLMTVEVIPYGKGRDAAVELRVHRRHRYETVQAVAPVPVPGRGLRTIGWEAGKRDIEQAVSDQDLYRMVGKRASEWRLRHALET